MSTRTVTKKRKSSDGATTAAKKVKITKSAQKPEPLKSALKKAPAEETVKEVKRPTNAKQEVSKVAKSTSMNGDDIKETEKTIVEDDEDGGTELTPNQTAALLAGFSSSEDDADSDEDEAGVAVSSLPKPPTIGSIQKRINQATQQNDPETTPGVIYIGRIPHGFYEHQMKAYFSQFGEIAQLKLARNKKTGRSRHYAFVEFASAAVADIVAKTMDKYLLFGHILQVRRVPREQVHEGMLKGAGRRKKPAPRNRLEGSKLKRGATREEWEKRVGMENKRRAEKAAKLKEIGYEFEMPDAKDVSGVPLQTTQIEQQGSKDEIDGDVSVVDNSENTAPKAVEKVRTLDGLPKGVTITEEVVTMNRPATGKTSTKKAVKKLKT